MDGFSLDTFSEEDLQMILDKKELYKRWVTIKSTKKKFCKKQKKKTILKKAAEHYLLNKEAIKKIQKIGSKIWKMKKNKQKKNIKKKYYKKLKACKDDLWPEKQKEVKKQQIITSKKRSKCKNMSKIKRNKIKSNLNGYNFAFA